MTRPAVRDGRYVIFPDGGTYKISRLDQLLFKLGLKKTMVQPKPFFDYETWKKEYEARRGQ